MKTKLFIFILGIFLVGGVFAFSVDLVNPTTIVAGQANIFKVTVNSTEEIIGYSWNFGNGDNQTTNVSEVNYTYTLAGDYFLKIIVTSNNSSAENTFDIIVSSPSYVANKTLGEKLGYLKDVREQVSTYTLFQQKQLNSTLGMDLLESKLQEIKTAYDSAVTDEDYNKIISDLQALKIPSLISTIKSADSLVFYPEESNINLDVLELIGGGTYEISEEDKYVDAVLFWNQGNLDTKVTFTEILAKYESEEPLLKIFEIDVSEKDSLSDTPYIILEKLDNLQFKDNYQEEEISGYYYIEMLESSKTIVFSTTEDVDFVSLPLFISPSLDKLIISSSSSYPPGEETNWTLFIIIIAMVIVIGIITYVILHYWYKTKYENYLFQNQNNLLNLITYIDNMKKKGLSETDIAAKLKASKWKSEQIVYALKKHAGKRTGMIGLAFWKKEN
ncbi:MAG: PKD domain-containing protein [archaeon]